MNPKIAVVVGTRPGIIKMAPLIKEIKRRDLKGLVIHTGQHYSYDMDMAIYNDIGLEQPHYRLNSGKHGRSHAKQTAVILVGVERVLLKEKPDVILVCGDANTNMASALAARKVHVKIGHVEAGLRSNDWTMPEEHNRVIIDHIAEYLYAPTLGASDNLKRENVRGEIYVVGNTVVDAFRQHSEIAIRCSQICTHLSLKESGYFVSTIHRQENVDDPMRLSSIVDAFVQLGEHFGCPIVLPVHPRTRNRLSEFRLMDRLLSIPNIMLIDPVCYLDMLRLIVSAQLVLTDSGGLQEEACIANVPCVTLRDNTERPETVKVSANIIAGVSKDSVLRSVNEMLTRKTDWPNPFGEGETAIKIIDTLIDNTNS